MHRLAALLLVVTVAAAARAHADTTALLFQSDGGDYIGGGVHRSWTPSDGTFTAQGSADGVTIFFDGIPTTWWSLEFTPPSGTALAVGTYESAERAPFATAHPGLDVSGSGRGCNTLTGRFVVLELELGAGNTVTRFAADFEQHCEGGTAALRGSIRFASTLGLPGDADGDGVIDAIDDCPTVADATQSDADEDGIGDACDPFPSSAANGGLPPATFLVFESDPGDFIGGGGSHAWTPADGPFTAQGLANGVQVRFAGGAVDWTLHFVPPSDQRLSVASYDGATRWPFQSPTKPGMDVSGSGRGCNTSTGRFVVRDLAIAADGTVKRFAVDFEQHCDGGAPALRGALRYRSAVPGPDDVDGDGRSSLVDNCPTVANPDQLDTDRDGIGDACDPFPNDADNLAACLARPPTIPDADADGVADATDRCPGTAAGEPVDATGCSLRQFCGAIDPTAADGVRICRRSDWQNDEPLMRTADADCRVERGPNQTRLCVPNVPAHRRSR